MAAVHNGDIYVADNPALAPPPPSQTNTNTSTSGSTSNNTSTGTTSTNSTSTPTSPNTGYGTPHTSGLIVKVLITGAAIALGGGIGLLYRNRIAHI